VFWYGFAIVSPTDNCEYGCDKGPVSPDNSHLQKPGEVAGQLLKGSVPPHGSVP
jgi:hypothetical protein